MAKNTTEIQSMEELLIYKREAKENKEELASGIQKTWDGLVDSFRDHGQMTPTQKAISYAQKAAMVYDSFMFGWKLYKKIKPGKKPEKKKGFFARLFS